MPRLARPLTLLAAAAVLVALLAVAPVLAGTFAPALLLFALVARGIRPGERHLLRLFGRGCGRRRFAAVRLAPPRLPLLVRPTGRLIAHALAVRPPPAAPLPTA